MNISHMGESGIFVVGERVEDKKDGHRGTVEYIGNVAGSEGVWVGVDWDEESRGKHNGCHKGVQYFNARTETSGSFVRTGRLATGVDLEFAVREKYQTPPPDNAPVESMLQHALNARFVQFVGMDQVSKKQSDLENLYVIDIKKCCISGPGTSDIRSILPKVRELSLCGNLLTSWKTVASIAKQLPTLRTLNLSDNKLKFDSDLDSSTFDHIDHLIINKMHGYSWDQLVAATTMFKNITNLQMAYNNLHSLGPVPEGAMEKVVELDVGANPLEQWEELLHISHLKSLQELNVNNCLFRSVSFPQESDVTGHSTNHFSSLKNLYLANNPLDNWRSVCQLAKLKSLEHLVLGFEVKPDDYFPEFTYAIIRTLKALNRTPVSRTEKRDYELFYLKSYSKDYFLNGGTEDPDEAVLTPQFLENHPTYLSIVRDIGAPYDDSKEVPFSRKCLRDFKITVSLSAQDGRTSELSFLPSITINRLKMTVSKTLKLPKSSRLKLYYVPEQRSSDIKIQLDNNNSEVSAYSIAQGDTLHVTW